MASMASLRSCSNSEGGTAVGDWTGPGSVWEKANEGNSYDKVKRLVYGVAESALLVEGAFEPREAGVLLGVDGVGGAGAGAGAAAEAGGPVDGLLLLPTNLSHSTFTSSNGGDSRLRFRDTSGPFPVFAASQWQRSPTLTSGCILDWERPRISLLNERCSVRGRLGI